ncbi:hypothetical protein IKF84_02130 [Candidatus Saccharibacteria bacterium]|nr:hypothetical protein [Candidatus Saccharibacteria bacterium]
MLFIWLLLGNVQPLGQMEKRGTSGGECYGETVSAGGGGPGTVNACIHSGSNTGSGGNTVWYNYVAASAETIKNSSPTDTIGNTIATTESICPKGWSLPTVKQSSNNTNVSIFSPVLGGQYNNGALVDESTVGSWWGSTTYNNMRRYVLYYDGNALSTIYNMRRGGLYIRCVSEEKDVSDLTYMQDMTAKVADSPKGWTLPSKDQMDTIGGASPGSNTYVPIFPPVLGGTYDNGTLRNESMYGYWWGSTADNGTRRYRLIYNGSSLYTYFSNRYVGLSIRCIQAS